MAETASAGGDHDQGVMNVTKDDQQKINRFARLNARFEDIKDELVQQSNKLQNYEDALLEAELGDKLHLQVGDILVDLDPDRAKEWLEGKVDEMKETVDELKTNREKLTEEMSQLKAHLYAKFGHNIHLESAT